MSGREIFDVSPIERKILEERQKRRTALRNEYLMQRLSPYKHATGAGGHIHDPAMQRYEGIRKTAYERFKPTWGNAAFHFGVTILPMFVLGYIVKKSRNEKEHLRRTGQVAYRDRTDKFC